MLYPSMEQFTTPVDEGYAALVGHAAYAFTYLEWQIVSIAQKIWPGFIFKVSKMSAGDVAKKFANKLTAFRGDGALKADLERIAAEFKLLVVDRNHLLHAHPATIAGQQRLHYWSPDLVFSWEPETLAAFIRRVQAISREAGSLYYDSRMP